MSESRAEQFQAYHGDGEVGGSSSSAAIPFPIQDEPDNSGEALPEYSFYDSVDGPAESAGGQDGGVGGPTRGESEGGADIDAPPGFDIDAPPEFGRDGGVRGVTRGESEGGADIDAPPEFEVYVPKVKRIRKELGFGDVLTISHDKHLNTDGEALHRWLLAQHSRPPSVQVLIQGTHTEKKRTGGKTEKKVVIDFHLTCDFTHLLLEQNHMGTPTLATVPPDQKAHRGHGRFKSIAKDLEKANTVRDWADQYCEDQSMFKEFVMKKVVVGHDQAYLKRHIEQCIRSTGYLGRISIKFPIYHTRVEVYPANRISKLRKTQWLRWVFCITFLWVFTLPYFWLVTKRYHVATMTWRMSRSMRDESGETRRECVLTEEEWMRHWGPAIGRAVKARRKGCLSEEDVMAARAALSGDALVRAPAPTYCR